MKEQTETLNDFQKKGCQNIINTLKMHKISEFFFKSPDPEFDLLPDNYSEIAQKAINLSVVEEKLENSEYKTVNDFKNDIQSVWDFFNSVYPEGTLQSCMIQQLCECYDKLSNLFSGNYDQDWYKKLEILKADYTLISKNGPESIFGKINQKHVKNEKRKSKPRPKESTKAKKIINTDNVPQTSSVSNQKNAPAIVKADTIPHEEILKLQEDMNDVATEDNMDLMINVIKENEQGFVVDGQEVEVSLEELKPQTIRALQSLVSKLKSQ